MRIVQLVKGAGTWHQTWYLDRASISRRVDWD